MLYYLSFHQFKKEQRVERDIFVAIEGSGFRPNGMQDPDLRRGFHDGLANVDPNDRRVLEAYWNLGTGKPQRTERGVAKLLQMDRHTVNSRLQRAIRTLRCHFLYTKDQQFKEALRRFRPNHN